MRVWLLLAFVARSAAANPPRTVLPPVDAEHSWLNPLGVRGHDRSTGAPGIDGVWTAGQIIDPGSHADARAYPLGMVIRPPASGDRNQLGAAPDGVPGLPGPEPADRELADRLLTGLETGLTTLLDLVLPATHL